MMYITLPIANPEKYNGPIEENANWVMCNICNTLSGCDFLVLAIKLDNCILLKPYEKVNCLEFEELFDFKMGSSDYDKDKVICIRGNLGPP